ncbi:hypothetical protein ACRAQ7_01865 [Erythrobacter sp. W53]|uniref:hypothetical protein n=1 Tax=Erythrobacter sp. W53 TaxID=3425947 RepID=UPI003D769BA7
MVDPKLSPPDHDPAASRFFILTLLRFASVGAVMLGIAISYGAIAAPKWLGIVLGVIGIGMFYFGTRRLARRWKSPDTLPPEGENQSR